MKYNNKAISSRLKQSYQTKQLKQLLLTQSIMDKILMCDQGKNLAVKFLPMVVEWRN